MPETEDVLDQEMQSLKNEYQQAWKSFKRPYQEQLRADPQSAGEKFKIIQKLFIYAASFLTDLKRSPGADVIAIIQQASMDLSQTESSLDSWQPASLGEIFDKFGVQDKDGLALRMIKTLGTKVDPKLVHRISS